MVQGESIVVQKPIRVLHVLGYFDRGGAESMVMNLYRSIDRNKVQFGFVVHGDRIGAFEDEVRQMGADIFRVPDYTGINHIQYKKAWRDIFSNHPEYSVVHGHVRSTANIYLNMAKRFDLKTIAHSHSTSSGSGLAAQVKNIFQYGIRQHADEFIACSTDAGQWLFGEKICNSNHFHILNNAIDTQDYIFDPEIRKKIRRELHASDKFLIGHVGRFHEAKNHSYLIDIFYECLKVQENAELVLVGEGKLKQEIKNKVQNLDIQDHVHFLGLRSDVNELLQAFDIFLFPSLFEGLPVTLVETQAAALPAVISDTITSDIIITEYITKVSLDEKPKKWAKIAMKTPEEIKRQDTSEEIKKAHYDIEVTSKWYTTFIEEIVNKK